MKQCFATARGEAGCETPGAGTGSFPHFTVIFRRAFVSSAAIGAKAVFESRLNSLVFAGGLGQDGSGLLESWAYEDCFAADGLKSSSDAAFHTAGEKMQLRMFGFSP